MTRKDFVGARIQLINDARFKIFVEEITCLLTDTINMLISCDNPEKRAVLAGRAQAYKEILARIAGTRDEFGKLGGG